MSAGQPMKHYSVSSTRSTTSTRPRSVLPDSPLGRRLGTRLVHAVPALSRLGGVRAADRRTTMTLVARWNGSQISDDQGVADPRSSRSSTGCGPVSRAGRHAVCPPSAPRRSGWTEAGRNCVPQPVARSNGPHRSRSTAGPAKSGLITGENPASRSNGCMPLPAQAVTGEALPSFI